MVQRTEIIIFWQNFFKLTGILKHRQPPQELRALGRLEGHPSQFCLEDRGAADSVWCLEDTEAESRCGAESRKVESTGLVEKGRCLTSRCLIWMEKSLQNGPTGELQLSKEWH